MAEQTEDNEKTEDPTHKRLEEARNKGDVAKSQEVNAWFLMLAITLVIALFAPDMAGSLADALRGYLAGAATIQLAPDNLGNLTAKLGVAVLAAVGLPLLLLAIGGAAGHLVQHGLLFTSEPMRPKLSKISPFAGAKRLFSTTSVVNFLKSLAKLGIVGLAMTLVLWPDRDRLDTLMSGDPIESLKLTRDMSVKLMMAVIAVLSVLAALDYSYQRHSWWKKQRMSVKELRDEHKQFEGDPQIRAKLRQVRVERGRKRMMANVPRASVVITNPTHYAVALHYEKGMSAPVCLAKGVDLVAARIREIAKENGIPLVENPPLARALHAGVDIDGEIDPEHYRAVAEVIGFVMRLETKAN